MEVKPGYKQTEGGMIPKEWTAEAIGSHVEIKSGESPSLFQFAGDGVPYFKVDQLNNNSKYLIDTPYFFHGDKVVSRGSLIFPKRGASILLNKIRILAQDSYMDTNLMTLTAKPSLDNEYLYYALTFIQLWRIADTTSIPQINNKHINPLVIPLPLHKEQRAIAVTLSDMDALIAKLDQLIAKKLDMKLAIMQQLLTGKRRLPGFSEKWEVKRVGEVFSITAGGDYDPSRSASVRDNVYCYPIYSNAISDKGLYGYCSYKDHEAGSITVTARGTLGVANYRDHNFTAIGRVLVLVSNEPVDGRFFSELINNRMEFVVESTGVPQLTAPQIAKYEIPFPSLPEQTAIASVLSDVDAEIAALEARRDKTRALKQGMMQELLTGRIRVV